jgi:Polysaccharide lyase
MPGMGFLQVSALLFGIVFSLDAYAADYLLNVNFANGTLPKVLDASGNATARVAEGAVRIDLDRYKDKIPERTELVPKNLPAQAFDNGKLARIGQEYWYGISVFVPSTWRADNSYEVVTQWHGNTQGAAIALCMDCLCVSAGLHGRTEIADRWLLMVNGKPINLGYIAPSVGKWVDWVFRIRWSPSSAGRVTVWRNKQQAVDISGPNMKPETQGPYWKFGIYKSPWKQVPSSVPIQSHRTLFFDNVHITQGVAISSF